MILYFIFDEGLAGSDWPQKTVFLMSDQPQLFRDGDAGRQFGTGRADYVIRPVSVPLWRVASAFDASGRPIRDVVFYNSTATLRWRRS